MLFWKFVELQYHFCHPQHYDDLMQLMLDAKSTKDSHHNPEHSEQKKSHDNQNREEQGVNSANTSTEEALEQKGLTESVS